MVPREERIIKIFSARDFDFKVMSLRRGHICECSGVEN